MPLKINQALKDARQKREKVANDIQMLLERSVKLNAPVGETGHLRRNSGAESKHEEDKSIIEVGANNVEYAKVVHEGSFVRNITGQPYIRDSIDQNIKNMQDIIHKGMQVK